MTTQSSQAPALNSDPSLTRQQQTSFPAHDPKGYNGAPKVDPGDSGASVSGWVDTAAVTAALEGQIAGEQRQGYRGFNPDPTPNEAYTVAGVTGQTSTTTTPSTPSGSPAADLLARLQAK